MFLTSNKRDNDDNYAFISKHPKIFKENYMHSDIFGPIVS